jgi:hypothetical protein
MPAFAGMTGEDSVPICVALQLPTGDAANIEGLAHECFFFAKR